MAISRIILALAVSLAALAGPAMAQEHDDTPLPAKNKWSFAGPFGKYDRAQLQRGFKVYQEVCLQCHGMQLLSYRNLAEPGGPAFTPAQVAAVAAQYKVPDGVDDQGKPVYRTDIPIAQESKKDDFGSTVRGFQAHQPQLFASIIEGILGGTLEWGLFGIGALIAISMELAGVRALPFAVGMYLPISISAESFRISSWNGVKSRSWK